MMIPRAAALLLLGAPGIAIADASITDASVQDAPPSARLLHARAADAAELHFAGAVDFLKARGLRVQRAEGLAALAGGRIQDAKAVQDAGLARCPGANARADIVRVDLEVSAAPIAGLRRYDNLPAPSAELSARARFTRLAQARAANRFSRPGRGLGERRLAALRPRDGQRSPQACASSGVLEAALLDHAERYAEAVLAARRARARVWLSGIPAPSGAASRGAAP